MILIYDFESCVLFVFDYWCEEQYRVKSPKQYSDVPMTIHIDLQLLLLNLIRAMAIRDQPGNSQHIMQFWNQTLGGPPCAEHL